MKPTTVKNILVILLVIFFSCSDLEEMPYSSITSASFFQNDLDAEAAIAGIYKGKNEHQYNMNARGFLEETGHFYCTSVNANYLQFLQGTYSYTHANINYMWRSRFEMINACNMAIKYIPNVPMDDSKRNELLAEAHWLRAKMYFDLVRLYGDLPKRTEPTESEDQAFLPRSPITEIYNEIIIPDLEFAAQHLPLSRTDGRVKRGAAPFLLGKVYLTMARLPLNDISKLPLAKEYLQDVINNQGTYGYRLMDNYIDVFPISDLDRTAFDKSKELNDELIFVIQESRAVPGHGTSIAFSFGPAQSLWTNNGNGGQGIMTYHGKILEIFEPTDERLEVSLPTSFIDRRNPNNRVVWGGNLATFRGPQRGLCQGKYIDPGQTACCDGNPDIIIYRLSDAYLMLAEVENLINNGPNDMVFDAMDVVRSRAKASVMDRTASWTAKTMDDFIYEERLRELTFEWHGTYDIRRFGKLEERIQKGIQHWTANISYDPKLELFPVPSEEMERNPKAIQNPGY